MTQLPTPTTAQFLEIKLDAHVILTQFTQARDWQEKYRHIMLLGKALPKLDESLKQESAQVRGCESNTWLYHKQIEGKHYFVADSDARIVKGLIALLLAACQGQTSEQIGRLNIPDYFKQLGLEGQLSPSRTNGLYALANSIKHYAASHPNPN